MSKPLLIDTSRAYAGSEKMIGDAIRKNGRENFFITTKVCNNHQYSETVEEGLNESLRNLGTNYVDLYLMHWPVSERYIEDVYKRQMQYKSVELMALREKNGISQDDFVFIFCGRISPEKGALELAKAFNKLHDKNKVKLLLVGSAKTGHAPVAYTHLDVYKRQVIHKENGGLSSARNAGYKAADGNYLMYIDSDDVIKPDIVERRCV